MPEVWVPVIAQHLTGGKQRIRVAGSTVRQVIDSLESAHPGMKALLSEGEAIMPGIAVIIDGEVTNIGMLARVQQESEVHFLPAIGGGTA